MSVRIEFYGIPRQRAGVDSTVVEDVSDLGQALRAAAARFPGLAAACVEDGRLRSGYIANINGRWFTSDPASPLKPGDSVLILSADAGG